MDDSADQKQTKEAFGFKWSLRDTYESEAIQRRHRAWMLERYCNNDPERLAQWLAGGRKSILDAGCGAAWSGLLFFGEHLEDHDYIGADISSSVEVARKRFEERGLPGRFIQASLFELPIEDESVDIIFSEGVLHHTDNTRAALLALTRKLRSGGRFLFYVYAKKGPIREFTDDHIREVLAPMSDQEAWEAIRPLTLLGKALGDLDVEVAIPEDIPYLGIRSGRMSIQRLFYWHVAKMFHSPELSLDELNHINFDWYRPLNCHRHTEDEVRSYCDEAGLDIEHFDTQPSGMTVVARKR